MADEEVKPPRRVADAGYFGPKGMWVRAGHRVPRKRIQISCRLEEDLIEEADKVAMEISTKPPYVAVSLSDLVRWGLQLAIQEYRPERKTNKPCVTSSRPTGNGGLAHVCIVCGSTDPEVCKYDK